VVLPNGRRVTLMDLSNALFYPEKSEEMLVEHAALLERQLDLFSSLCAVCAVLMCPQNVIFLLSMLHILLVWCFERDYGPHGGPDYCIGPQHRVDRGDHEARRVCGL
jgi:hypothetical protein